MRTPYTCPVCSGTGLVSRPPGVAGDAREFTTSSWGPWPCRPCNGTGILWDTLTTVVLRVGDANAGSAGSGNDSDGPSK